MLHFSKMGFLTEWDPILAAVHMQPCCFQYQNGSVEDVIIQSCLYQTLDRMTYHIFKQLYLKVAFCTQVVVSGNYSILFAPLFRFRKFSWTLHFLHVVFNHEIKKNFLHYFADLEIFASFLYYFFNSEISLQHLPFHNIFSV